MTGPGLVRCVQGTENPSQTQGSMSAPRDVHVKTPTRTTAHTWQMSSQLQRGSFALSSNLQLCFQQEEEKSVPNNMESTPIATCKRRCWKTSRDTKSYLHQEMENSMPSVRESLACAKRRCTWRAPIASTETRNQCCARVDSSPNRFAQVKLFSTLYLKTTALSSARWCLRLATNENDVDAAQSRCTFSRDTLN